LTNIILDPIFIFVLGLGIRGAAIATVLAKIIGVSLLLRYYVSGRSALRITLKQLRPNLRIILDIYKVGLPALLMQISANISLILANRILGGFGFVPIAVMGLMVRFQMFAFMPAIGIAQGLLPIIGYNYGAKKYPRIREAMVKGAGAGTVLVTLAGAALFLFPAFFIRIFDVRGDLEVLGSFAVRIMVLMYPLLGVQIVSVLFFQAIGRGTQSLVLSLLRQFLLYIPFILVLPRFFGLTGIWIATPLADLLAFLVTTTLVGREFSTLGIPFLKVKNKAPTPGNLLED
jgi:Na+-driven multidrug efflux pump